MKRRCIHCGCRDDRACLVPIEDDLAEEYGIRPGALVPCSWASLKPPVCNNPTCLEAQRKATRRVPSTRSR